MSPAQRRGKPGKRQGQPGPAPRKPRAGVRRLVALILAAALVLTVVGYAVGEGLGPPDIPSGDVVYVQDSPGGDITQEDYDATLKRTALGAGLKTVPSESDPQFAQLQSAALQQLIVGAWYEGEAEAQGITVADSQIEDKLDQIKKQNHLTSEKQFEAAIAQQGFTLDQAKEAVKLQIISQRVQNAVLPSKPPEVTDEDVQSYYDANIAQFQRPETRDFRVILNKDQAQVQAAADALAKNDSASSWKTVASKYSTDPTTKSTGGLRQGVAKGQSEPKLDDEVFSAPTGQLIGPFQGENGFYLIEVEKVTPASTAPLNSQLSTQIKQQLQSVNQQKSAQTFQTQLTATWLPRTFCTSEVSNPLCENYKPPVTTCTAKLADQKQCPTPVIAIRPFTPQVLPATAGAQAPPPTPAWDAEFISSPTVHAQGPQYPAPPVPQALPTGLPGSAVPSGTIPPSTSGSGG